ncbi:MAG: PAS domain S-box protein [Nitrospira sp.]
MSNWRTEETDPQGRPISAEFWAFVLEGSGIGLWDWNVTTNRVEFSRGWQSLFGYAEDEIGDSLEEWTSRVHPDDRPHATADAHRYDQEVTARCAKEYRMRCKDGSYKWVQERRKILSRYKDGKPLRILGSHTDITEHKQLAQRLTIQHEVANVLANASGLNNAIAAILRPVCQTLGWEEGLLWVVDEPTQSLRCHSIWTVSGTGSEHYGIASRELTFQFGVGLPGRVWAQAKPVWISDVTRDQNFPRAALAEQVGFHTAAAFPVRLADRVYAVLEFFHHEILPADPSLLTTFQAVADQLSQFCARERAEERLRQTQFAMEQAVDAIYWIDVQAKILYANEAASLMMGHSREELLGMTVHDLNPDFPVSMWPGFWEETRRNKTMSLETTHHARDGRVIPVEIRVSFLAYEGQEFHCAFVRDITDRKRAEEALRSSEERFSKAFNGAAIGMSLVAPDGRWLQVNQSLCDIVGYTAEELLATTFQTITHPDDLKTDLAFAQRLLAGDIRTYQMEKRYVHKQGHIVWIVLGVSLVRHSDGTPQYFISQIQDVTERKLAEAKLAQAAHDPGTEEQRAGDRPG